MTKLTFEIDTNGENLLEEFKHRLIVALVREKPFYYKEKDYTNIRIIRKSNI